MSPLRVLVADDEPLARGTIRQLLATQDDVDVRWEASDGQEAVDAVRQFRPDLVFLDVQMPALDGFEVVQTVGPEAMPTTVFVTAYDQYAVRAFDMAAVDYLLKPYDDERFFRALDRARDAARRHTRHPADLAAQLRDLLTAQAPPEASGDGADAPEADGSPVLDRLLVREGKRLAVLRTEAIDWAEAEGDYVALHVGPRTHLVRETLTRLGEQLGPRFVRVHRSRLVNLDRVRDLRPTASGDCTVRMTDGSEVRASRRYWRDLADRFGGAR
ncbi:MAG: response regulator [Bacteroidota bacterium]